MSWRKAEAEAIAVPARQHVQMDVEYLLASCLTVGEQQVHAFAPNARSAHCSRDPHAE
jgi:hypothetical protein